MFLDLIVEGNVLYSLWQGYAIIVVFLSLLNLVSKSFGSIYPDEGIKCLHILSQAAFLL